MFARVGAAARVFGRAALGLRRPPQPAFVFFLAARPLSSLEAPRLKLNMLTPAPGSRKQKRRRGRGGTRGKTSGAGHKGQGKYGGLGKLGFEGGQTPIYKRLPKVGFTNNFFKKPLETINVSRLQDYLDMGKLLPNEETREGVRLITMRELERSGICGKGIKHGVKLLGDGSDTFRTPVHIEVSKASRTAIEAIEQAGGTVTCAHYNRLALRALLKPHKFHVNRVPRRARPPPKHMPYYLDYAKRGEFSPEVQLRNVRLKLHKPDVAPLAGSIDATNWGPKL